MSNVHDRYIANYQKIAADHVKHWRVTGKNPFQTDDAVRGNENVTVDLVKEFGIEKGNLLDAGCGMGDLMLRLTDYKPEGVEIAIAYLEIGRAHV